MLSPGLNMREHPCFCYCKFFFKFPVQLQCLQRAPGRRVTEKSQLFHTNCRSSGDGEWNPGHLRGRQRQKPLRHPLQTCIILLYPRVLYISGCVKFSRHCFPLHFCVRHLPSPRRLHPDLALCHLPSRRARHQCQTGADYDGNQRRHLLALQLDLGPWHLRSGRILDDGRPGRNGSVWNIFQTGRSRWVDDMT
jgi:hypothetical protein